MYSIKGNGNNIANEFSRLIGNSQNIKKVAQEQTVNNPESQKALKEAAEADRAAAEGSEDLENEISDLIVDDSAAESLAMDTSVSIENQISDMETYSSVKRDLKKKSSNGLGSRAEYILSGLGKISSSLRSKGEGFAADVVEATANSIEEDFKKEAGRKTALIDTLSKMASDFSSSGDQFAADMVTATVNKINN